MACPLEGLVRGPANLRNTGITIPAADNSIPYVLNVWLKAEVSFKTLTGLTLRLPRKCVVLILACQACL